MTSHLSYDYEGERKKKRERIINGMEYIHRYINICVDMFAMPSHHSRSKNLDQVLSRKRSSSR